MNKVAIALGILVFALGTWWWFGSRVATVPTQNSAGNSLSPPTLTTPGGLGLRFDDKAYGLAVNPEQVLVKSFIPPCDEGFDYCIYRLGDGYAGTNFESAGLRIEERAELPSEVQCLMTSPQGYEDFAPSLRYVGEGFASSIFTPLEGAATGHYSKSALYRLHYDQTCYEFEARVGASQLGNYPPGSVEEFTDEEWAKVYQGLIDILAMTSIANGTQAIFPVP